jgi:hypothetical protein
MNWRVGSLVATHDGDELSHRGCTLEHEFEMMMWTPSILRVFARHFQS